MAKVTTIPLFKNQTSGAQGTAGTVTSDVIDLRNLGSLDKFSLSYTLASTHTASGTVGTTNFMYLCSPTRDGSYVSPSEGTFGTSGPAVGDGFFPFSPVVAPFMKIRAISGTSNPAIISADLHVK